MHFEWFLGGYNVSVGCYSGIQWNTEGYNGDIVGYTMGDTMSVLGRTTSIPRMHLPNTKERFLHCRRIGFKWTKLNKIKHTEAVGKLKCLHNQLTNYPVVFPPSLLLEWSNVIKQVGTHCRFLSLAPQLQLSGSFLNDQKYFT